MNPERLRQIEELYHSVRESPVEVRAALLQKADPELRREVESLLERDVAAGLMDRPAMERLAADVKPTVLAAGTHLGPYKIEGLLGEGGMGSVYRALDTRLHRHVAIKVSTERFSDRFEREARAAAALNHPHICTLHDVGSDYLVMEMVSGQTLEDLLSKRRLKLPETLKYAVQIADAVTAAHAAGIVHRDLKPANVMITDTGLVKVLDFGLAKLTDRPEAAQDDATRTDRSLTEEGAVMGSAAYMSPEQAEGRKVDARSDIFSFGLVLYEMLSGRRAFRAGTRVATIAAILHEEPSPLGEIAPELPKELEWIVTRCLRKDMERRWQTMQDLRVALQALSEESKPGPAADVPHSPRRRRWLLAVPVGLLVVGTGSWMLWKGSGPQPIAPKLLQLTSFPGFSSSPSFSPDGDQVTFAWTGLKQDNFNIYVKMVGEENALRLTTDPAPEQNPTWSPDGKRIAFQRFSPGAPGIWSVSPLGGAEQKLADIRAAGPMSWSREGKWLAVSSSTSDGGGLLLVPADGGVPRRISSPKPPAFDTSPSFSPDGRLLAYASCPRSQWACDIYVQQFDADYIPRDAARRVTRQGVAIGGIAWSRDGRSLVYSGSLSWGISYRLWRVSSSGKEQPQRFDLAGFNAMLPSVAREGDRLAYQRVAQDYDIWRYQPGGVAEPFIRSSSLSDYNTQFSPDGRKIAFSSDRGGDIVEIWTADADGSHPVQLTKGPGHGQGSPRWSPDGRLIAFDSLSENGLSEVYVVDANGGRPRRLSSGASNESVPSWSRDGKWIYFASDRTGRDEVWRVPMGGGQAQQITKNGGGTAFESADGKTLFYEKGISSPLFAKPLTDSTPERQILDLVVRRNFAPTENGIYYIGKPEPDGQFPIRFPIRFYEFSTGTSDLLTKVGGQVLGTLTVSPDRKTILFSVSATSGSDLMLIENFR